MANTRLDPLGQSFLVDRPLFLTKVDLFFADKDDNLPVFMQIRKNKNGVPSTDLVPLSQTIIPSANVLTSTNANVATTVTFSSPVFLDIGEYTLTLGSDSKDYKVYVSELDGSDTLTSRRITEQPLLGSLFKSQNASTWTPTQLEDLKFKLYRAKFDKTVTATVNFNPNISVQAETLDIDPLELNPNSIILKVHHFNNGLYDNAYVRFINVANANVTGNVSNLYGYAGNTLQGPYFQVSNVKLDSYTITMPYPPSITATTRFGGTVVVEKDILYSTIIPTLATLEPANTTTSHKVITTTPSSSSFTVDSSYSLINNKEENKLNTTRALVGGPNKIYKTSNVVSYQHRVELVTEDEYVSPVIDLKQAGVILRKNLINNPTYSSVVKAHEISRVANVDANVYAISSTIGLINLKYTSDRSNARAILNGSIIQLSANTATNNLNDGNYRVIEVLDSGANVKVAKLSGTITTDVSNSNIYLILNSPSFIAEEAAVGGSAYSKYITRQVDFLNPSTSIKFFTDVAKPGNSNLEFYYKAKVAGDNTNFDKIEYTKITAPTIPTSLGGEFYEISKQVDSIPAFNSIIFKIVLLSDDESQVPVIKNFRLIALE